MHSFPPKAPRLTRSTRGTSGTTSPQRLRRAHCVAGHPLPARGSDRRWHRLANRCCGGQTISTSSYVSRASLRVGECHSITLRSAHGEVTSRQRCGRRLGHPVGSVPRGLAVKRLVALVLVVGALVGCVSVSGSVGASAGESVQLLTGAAFAGSGCYTDFAVGLLSVDPTYGTAVKDETSNGHVVPVMWRPGYTALRVGSEVSVLDPAGTVVATTGHRYKIAGGYVSKGTAGSSTSAFWACGFVTGAP
jgi:hypothetical protein